MQEEYMIALAVLVVVLLVLFYAYHYCKFGLNSYLPTTWQNSTCTDASDASTTKKQT
jgi:hypothetical protein